MTTLITGATRGVGRALAEESLRRGHPTLGTTRGAALPQGVEAFDLEATDPGSHQALGRALKGRPIDLLILNAGVLLDRDQSLATGYPAQMWAEEFAINVTAPFLTIQALLPGLRAAKGKIAIISSQLGSSTRASGGRYIYCASKSAVLNLGRNLATDLRREGIAVGIYHPGWVRTDMGGQGADIPAEEAARGLMDRFAALSLATTGCFETWDGQAHPF